MTKRGRLPQAKNEGEMPSEFRTPKSEQLDVGSECVSRAGLDGPPKPCRIRRGHKLIKKKFFFRGNFLTLDFYVLSINA